MAKREKAKEAAGRRRAQEALRDVVAGARCILWDADVQEGGHWRMRLYASDITLREFGLHELKEGDAGEKWASHIHPEHMEKMNRTCMEALRSGAPGYQQEFIFRDSKGKECWLREDAKITKTGPGLFHLVGVCVDITERKRAEERLAREEMRFRSLAQILQHPADTLQDFLDFALEKAIQVTASGIGYLYFYHADRQQFVLSSWSRDVMKEGTIVNPQTCYELDKTGLWGEAVRQRRTIIANDFHAVNSLNKGYPEGYARLDRYMTIPVFSGQEIVAVVGVANKNCDYDDTDAGQLQVLMDAVWKVVERRRAEIALTESEERYQRLTHAVTDYVYTVKVIDGRAVETIHGYGCAAVTGYLSEEFAANPYLWFDMVQHDDRVFVQNCGRRLLAGEEVGPYEHRIVRKDGAVRWVRNTPSLHRDRTGKLLSYDGLISDITERKRLEERLRQAEKMEAIGQLAGGVAHDFNNQLTGIMGYANLLTNRLDDPELKRYAESILSASRRSADLTRQLLAFARKGQYQSMAVDLHDIVQEVASILERSIDKRIRIKLQLDARPSKVLGDPSQLENALLNLGLNARDAMAEGGDLMFATEVRDIDEKYCRKVRYEVIPGRYLYVRVADSGVGMPKDVQEHLFEPFYTTKEQGKGTGMGLAAVYGTVKNHRGFIEVTSRLGRGTTVELFIPLHEASLLAKDNPAVPVETPPRSVRILVVDDEPMIRDTATDMLGAMGHQVVTCQNGAAAVAYYQQHWREIDLVILDMIMPDRSGREVFAAMRQINPQVRALLSSGYSLNEEAQGIMREGVLGFVGKPYSYAELARNVAEAMRPTQTQG